MAGSGSHEQVKLFFGVNPATRCDECAELNECLDAFAAAAPGSNARMDRASRANELTQFCPGRTVRAIGNGALQPCMSPAAANPQP